MYFNRIKIIDEIAHHHFTDTPIDDSSSSIKMTNENQLGVRENNPLIFKNGRQQSTKSSGNNLGTSDCNDSNDLQNDTDRVDSAEGVKVQSTRTHSLILSSQNNCHKQATQREYDTDKNIDQAEHSLTAVSQHDDSYTAFVEGLNATTEHGLDVQNETNGLHEKIGDLSKSFSSAFPGNYGGQIMPFSKPVSFELLLFTK